MKIKEFYKSIVKYTTRIYQSKLFMAFIAIATAVLFCAQFITFNGDLRNVISYYCGNIGIVFFSIIMVIGIVFTKDISLIFMPLVSIPIIYYDTSPNVFKNKILFIVCAAFVIGTLLIKTIINIKNIRVGKLFFPMLAISIVVSIGGIGTLPFKEYVKFPGVVHYLSLGIGLVLMYLFVTSMVYKDGIDSLKIVAYGCVFIALSLCIIIGISLIFLYIRHIATGASTYMQWKNLTSQLLLLTIPGIYYLLNTSEKNRFWYVLIIVASILLAISTKARISLVFGILILLIFLFLEFRKQNYLKIPVNLVVTICLLLILFLVLWVKPIDLFKTGFISKGEARVGMYKIAFQTFLQYPFLGHGLLYVPRNSPYVPDSTVGLYWVHQNLLQVLSSFGIVGFFAYGYSIISSIKHFLKTKGPVSIFAIFFIAVYIMLGVFDIVGFMLVPYQFVLVFVLVSAERKVDIENNLQLA